MGVTEYVGAYLLLASICFIFFYYIAVKSNGRLLYLSCIDDSIPFEQLNVPILLRLLFLDFFKIHCPWSWKTAVHYRVKEAHRLLQRSRHEKGWRAEDCHHDKNHEQIARDCFQSRIIFWSKQMLRFIASPPRLLLTIFLLFIALLFAIANAIAQDIKSIFATRAQ